MCVGSEDKSAYNLHGHNLALRNWGSIQANGETMAHPIPQHFASTGWSWLRNSGSPKWPCLKYQFFLLTTHQLPGFTLTSREKEVMNPIL